MTAETKNGFSKAIAKAILDAQRAAKPVGKNAQNQQFGYSYASSESVIEGARAALNGAGLALVTLAWEHTPGTNSDSGYATGQLHVVYVLVHAETGETLHLPSRWFVAVEKGRPLEKAVAIALTANLAYVLRGLLLIPRLDDSAETERPAQRPRPAPPATAPGEPVIPFGQTRGTPIGKADERDLAYCIERLSRNLLEKKVRPEECDAAERLLVAMQNEIKSRVKRPTQEPTPPAS